MLSRALSSLVLAMIASGALGPLAMLCHARQPTDRAEPPKRPLSIVVHVKTGQFRVPGDFASPVAELEITASTPTHVGSISVGCTCVIVDATLPIEIGAKPVRIPVRIDQAEVKPGKFEYAVVFLDGQKIVGCAPVKFSYEPYVYVDPPMLDVADASWDASKNLREVRVMLTSPEAVEQCRIEVEGNWEILKVRREAMGLQLEVSPIRRPTQQVSEGRLRIDVPPLESPHVVPLRAVFEPPVKVEPTAVIFDAAGDRKRVLRITSEMAFDLKGVESDSAWVKVGELKRVDPQMYEVPVECSAERGFAEATLQIHAIVNGEPILLTLPIVRAE